MRFKNEEGQAVVVLALAMGIFLLGAVGLAIDGEQLYAQFQMAQAAADASAIAGIMDVFAGTYNSTTNSGKFSVASSFSCDSTHIATTPCVYAVKNGFGSTSADTVTISFPTSAPGVTNLSGTDPTALVRVDISRSVGTTLMRLLGPTATTIKATATAAIVNVQAPTPILVTDPNNANTLSGNGNTSIKICGGPSRSIQVNSRSSGFGGGFKKIDLSKAGPLDTAGDCTLGTGADFGTFGGQATNPGDVSLGSSGNYDYPASPIQDPLAGVAAPGVPAAAPASVSIKSPTDGCTSTCTEYSPGLYVGGLNAKNDTILFKPGIYYMQGGGFTLKNVNGGAANFGGMCSGCAADPNTGTGMVVYDTGPAGSTLGSDPSGGFTIDTNVSIQLHGSSLTTVDATGHTVPGPPYYGILFFEDHKADPQSHGLGQGNGCYSLIGTVYITNSLSVMTNTADPSYPNHVQKVTFNGNPCSTTLNQGEIIVGQLGVVGTSTLTMDVFPYSVLNVRQVALVN